MATALLLVGGTASLRAQQIQHAESRRQIVGIVTDSATHQPLAGANITVIETRQSVLSDSTGRFRIAGFLPPVVTVAIEQLGYANAHRRVDLTRSDAVVEVALATKAVELSGIDVSGDRETATFLNAKQATTTMTVQQVEQKRGQTMVETIKELPGVAVIQYGPSIAKPVVRGLHSQRIATVTSGVPLEGQQWGGEHAPEVDAFAANEIEVIRGPGTILYGSGALGGVVRVMPRPLPTGSGVGGELSTNSFWNNRQGAASLLLEGGDLRLPGLGALGWRAQFSARRAGDARAPAYYLPNTGFEELDFNAALGMSRSWGRTELDYSHFGTHLGLYIGAHVGNLDDLQRAMDSAYTTNSFAYTLGHPDQKVRHELLAWRTELNLTPRSRLDVAYGFQYNDRQEFDNHGFAVGNRPAFALELYTHTLDVKYHHPPVGRLAGTIGFSGMRQGNLSPGRSFLIPQYRLYAGGVYALEELSLDRLTLTAGARYDDRWQHAYQFGAPVVVSPEDRHTYLGASGSLGASWKLSGSWSLGGTVGRAWRPPNVNERFSQGVHHGTAQYEIGDPSLGPESSFNVDGTLRHLSARTRLELSAYRNQIDGFIFLEPRDPVVTVRGAYPAYDYAHANALLKGLEITGELTPAAWLSFYGNANIVRGSDRATGAALYDMPADRITASVRFTGGSGEHLLGPWLEIGTTQVLRQTRVPPVTIYKLPTAGYGLYNLELGAAALHVGELHVEPSLALRNVFDTRYRDYLSRYRLFVDEPGRDVVLRFTVPFHETGR